VHRSPLREDGRGTYPTLLASKWLKSSLERLSDKSLWRPWKAALSTINGAETALQTSSEPLPELRNEALLELSDSLWKLDFVHSVRKKG
jgi:hypothetical protein